jgi:phosphate transport system substrate-binding protein
MRLPVTSLVIVFAAVALAGCSSTPRREVPPDTYNQGRVKIVVDETLRPLLEQEVLAFQQAYPDALIDAYYLPQGECIRQLVTEDDTVRLFIGTRQLTEAELSFFRAKGYTPSQTPAFMDGVAVVLNSQITDSTLSNQQIRDILSGRATRWSHLGVNRPGNDSLALVFDNAKSSTLSFLADSFLSATGDTLMAPRIFGAGTNPAVMDYVARNPNAIGFIGYNWLSDPRQDSVRARLGQVYIARLQNPDPRRENDYINLPEYPAFYLIKGKYPLRRVVYVIKRETHRGLGTGFESFLTGPEGQRLAMSMNVVGLHLRFDFRDIQLQEGDLTRQQNPTAN